MAMRFEHRGSGDYAGRFVWEGEAGGFPVACHITGHVDGRPPEEARAMSPDEVEDAGGWFLAACNAVGAGGLCAVAGDEFGSYAECAAYLEDVVDRVEEGEFDELLGKGR